MTRSLTAGGCLPPHAEPRWPCTRPTWSTAFRAALPARRRRPSAAGCSARCTARTSATAARGTPDRGTRHAFDRIEFDAGRRRRPGRPAAAGHRRTRPARRRAAQRRGQPRPRRTPGTGRPPTPAGPTPDERRASRAERLAIDGPQPAPVRRAPGSAGTSPTCSPTTWRPGTTRIGFVAVRRRPAPRRRPRRRAGAAYPELPAPPPGYRLQPVHAWQRDAVLPRPVRATCSPTARCASSTAELPARAHRRAAHPAAAARRGRAAPLPEGVAGHPGHLDPAHISVGQHPQRPGALRRCCTGCSPTTRTAAGCCCWPRRPAPPCRPAPAATCRAILRAGLDRPARRRARRPCPAARCRPRPATGRTVLAGLVAGTPHRGRRRRRRRAGFVDEYARLLLPPLLRLATRYGIGAGGAPAELPADLRRRACRTGWSFRDFAGLRLHPPRLAAAGTPLGAVAGLGRRHRRRRRACAPSRLHRAAGPPRRAGRPARRLARPRRGRRLAGGARVVDEVYDGAARRPGHRRDAAPTTPRSPRRRCRTRRWCGCGWPAPATSTCPCRIRCMRHRLSRPSRGRPLRARARRRPVCAYVYDRAALRDAGRGGARRAARRAPRCCTRSRPTGTRRVRRPGRRRATASRSPPAASSPLAARRRARGGSSSAARPRPTPSWPPRSPPARMVNVESALRAAPAGRWSRRGRAGPRVALRVNRAGAALPGSHAMTGAPTPFGIDEAAAARGGRRWPPRSGAAAGRLPPARRLQQPGRRRARRVRRRRGGLVGGRRAPARRRPALRQRRRRASASTTPATPRFDLAALRARPAPARPACGWSSSRAGASPPTPGWYAAEVLDLKRTHGRWFAVLRGGTHHFRLPAAWGYSHPFTVLPVDGVAVPVRPARGARRRRSTRSASCARRATC